MSDECIFKETRTEAPPISFPKCSLPLQSEQKISKKAQNERFGIREYWIADPVHYMECFHIPLVHHELEYAISYNEMMREALNHECLY